MERERAGSAWSAVVDVFGRRQLRAAELAFAWAHLGEWAFTVALAVVAFRDGGASGVGLVAVVRMVPSAIGTPVIIAVADRARRDRVLVVVSAVRVVTIGGAALALALGGHRVVFYGLVVVASVVFTAFRPVHSSLLPLLCTTTAELMSANVVRGLLASIATLLGPLLAAGLLAWAGAATVFATAAGLSLLAATSLLRVPSYVDGTVEPVERVQLVQGTLRGLKALRSEPDVRRMFGLGFAQTYTRGALNVFAVVIAFDLLDIGESGVATLTAAVGLGGVVGSAVASLMVGSRRLGAWLVIALALWGTPIAMIGAVPETFAAFALLGVVGVANSIIDVPLFTLPVRLVPDDVLAPLFGVFESMIAIGVALGSAMTPAAIGILGVRGAMIASGLLLPLVGLIAWPRLRALDAAVGGARRPDPGAQSEPDAAAPPGSEHRVPGLANLDPSSARGSADLCAGRAGRQLLRHRSRHGGGDRRRNIARGSRPRRRIRRDRAAPRHPAHCERAGRRATSR